MLLNNYKLFIGSSKEALKIAEVIQENLAHECEAVVWNQGFFGLGQATLESLIENIEEYDFVIIVLSADDILKSRNQKYLSPRDNAIFELGLYIGKLGYKRTFFVYDQDCNLKLPSDLAGYSGVGYKTPVYEKDWISALGPASTKIKRAMNNLGIRPKKRITDAKINIEVDIYYHLKGLTKENAAVLSAELTKSGIKTRISEHDDLREPDAVFIGACVPAEYVRLVLKSLTYTIKYIFRLDYPASEGGDPEGLKIGVGYVSNYNSLSRSYRSNPVHISKKQLEVLLDPKKSNTEFHCYLYELTMVGNNK